MLSNIASYLGYPTVADEPPTMDVRLRAIEGDDDWILVERNEQEQLDEGDEEEDRVGATGVTRVSLAISTLSGTSRCVAGAAGDGASSSLDIPCALQESWYLTPPPSFTSQGPVHMETSPFENLLIEHPSMSVYQHSQSCRTSPSSTTSDEEPFTLRPIANDSSTLQKLPKKEKLNKLPRNKLNTKFSKKLSNKRPQASSSDEGVSIFSDDDKIYKEQNVKSPKRSLHHVLKNPFSSSDETISTPSANEDEEQAKPTRRLYSEVLGCKVKPAVVMEETKSQMELENQVKAEEKDHQDQDVVAVAVDDTSVTNMSVEDMSTNDNDRDKKRVVQTISGQQQRQHLLNRSAQKTEQRKTCDTMKRNSMGRNNKAREINSRNKRQRRADMMQRHSGANNNRKSC